MVFSRGTAFGQRGIWDAYFQSLNRIVSVGFAALSFSTFPLIPLALLV